MKAKLSDLPEVKGINLGEPEKQKLSYEQIMKMLLDRGKVYYGRWPKRGGESTESHFRRILEPLGGEKKGPGSQFYNLNKEEQRNPEKVMKLWHSLQG